MGLVSQIVQCRQAAYAFAISGDFVVLYYLSFIAGRLILSSVARRESRRHEYLNNYGRESGSRVYAAYE